MPARKLWDYIIKTKKELVLRKRKIYLLLREEKREVYKFIKEQLRKEYRTKMEKVGKLSRKLD